MTGGRGRRIEPIEEAPDYTRQPHPVSEKTDRELRRAICVGSMCPRCENRGVCEYGKEAIARGFFGGPVAKAKKPEDEAKRHEWFLRGVPESEERQELLQQLQQVIEDNLTEQDRRVLSLHYEEDMTYSETAKVLGISASAVNKHITRSLAKIRKYLNAK